MDWLTNALDHLCKAVQINTFVTQPLNRMRQNEKNRHKNRLCKRAFECQKKYDGFDVCVFSIPNRKARLVRNGKKENNSYS